MYTSPRLPVFARPSADRPAPPAAQGGNIAPFGIEIPPLYAGLALALVGGLCLSRIASRAGGDEKDTPGLLRPFLLFFYSSFIKPHQGDRRASQQDALESFYKTQAGAYDATRRVLLRGREDMLGLVAAQLESKRREMEAAGKSQAKRVWVDVGAAPRPRVQPG